MKYLLIFIINCSLISNAFSQLNVGKSVSPTNLYVSSHNQKVFDSFKNTTTYFIVPDEFDIKQVEKIIKEIWNFTSIKFIYESEYWENNSSKKKYISTDYSFIRLINRAYKKTKGITTVAEYISFKFIFYKITKMEKKKKELKTRTLSIAEIFFTPSISFRRGIVSSSGKTVWLKSDKKNTKEPDFYNYNLGYIKNYFQMLNRTLNNSENLKMKDGITNKTKLKDLKDKVLYVPDWILKKYNPLNVSLKKNNEPTELFKKYDSKYKVISNEELNSKILEGDDFYYLMHTQFNQVKIVSIINSKSGEIIYLKQENSYNIKDSDLKTINKLIN